jgi:glycosyltransferase involved in cell wall biosynthesis
MSHQRRVLVYTAQMEPVGGIESHVREFCLRLSSAGHRVTLLASRFALSAETTQLLQAAGIELRVNRATWTSGSASTKFLWTLWALLRLVGRRFDAVYTNGQGRNPALVHAWYRGRVRLVHHHHTSCDAGDVATWPRSYMDAMRRADALIVCARYIRTRMQAAIGRDDVRVVYCFTAELALTAASSPRHAESLVVFGYYGRLIAEKGIDWIMRLSAEPRLHGIMWRLWGVESTYRQADFERFPNLSFRGAFSGSDGLRQAIEELDCFCLFSSHPEGIPISLIEFMQAGKPWIATAQGGIPELAHDASSCAIVSLHDYESVVEVCLAMEQRIRAAGIDGDRQREFYRAHFAQAALLPQWTELLIGS